MHRRGFLRLLGLGATATAAAAGLVLPELEPVRRSNVRAPMPSMADDDWRFAGANPGLMRFASRDHSVQTYIADEYIPIGSLVALAPNGRARVARGDYGDTVVGMVIRNECSFGGGTPVRYTIDAWMASPPPVIEWLGPKGPA